MKPQVRPLEADELTCRPGSVLAHLTVLAMGDHPSGTAVAGDLVRSTRELGRAALERSRGPLAGTFLTLLQVGFAEPSRSPGTLVVSYTAVSPLPLRKRGGLFSVALSRGSPRVGVTHHLALWSPDLPRRQDSRRRGRPVSSSARPV